MNIDQDNLSFRLELAKELSVLKTVLLAQASRFNISLQSIGTIDKAIKNLQDRTILPQYDTENPTSTILASSPMSWGYSIKPFKLNVDLDSSIQYPKKIYNATLEFSIEVVGEFDKDLDKIRDPFRKLEFNIVIEGESRRKKKHVFAYHLDRHIKGGVSKEIHPIYHFQLGGRKLDPYKRSNNFGNYFIADTPRFMHYPMDFITGLDFIFSNFKPDLWKVLKGDPRYLRILHTAQHRTLRPFVACLSEHFKLHTGVTHWQSNELIPQILNVK